jgi:hypothetical protein
MLEIPNRKNMLFHGTNKGKNARLSGWRTIWDRENQTEDYVVFVLQILGESKTTVLKEYPYTLR